VTAPTGTGLEYSINGTTWQTTLVFANVNPGTYTLSVKNAGGCIASSPVTVNPVPGAPTAPVATVTQPTCTQATGTITITAPVGAGLEYSINGTTWQSGTVFSNVNPGTYTVSVKNAGGCIASSPVTVNPVPGAPTAPVATVDQPTCTQATGTITVTAPVGTGLEYSINGTTWQTTLVFANVNPGTYTVSVKNAGGCIASSPVTVKPVPGAPTAPVATVDQPTCTQATGTITITAPVGTGLEYSINGTTWQTGTVFNNVNPGT
jgi:hypothetical protein